jgi:hypothetical protein
MTEKKRYRSAFPKTIGQCVEPLTRPVFKAQGLAGARIISNWPQIVGPELAAHCVPQKLSFPAGKTTDGTLTVAVENGFAPEIQHLQPVILERLAHYFGYRAVSRLTISHSFLPATEKSKKHKVKTALEPVSMSEEITDPELKMALQSLAETLSGNADDNKVT